MFIWLPKKKYVPRILMELKLVSYKFNSISQNLAIQTQCEQYGAWTKEIDWNVIDDLDVPTKVTFETALR